MLRFILKKEVCDESGIVTSFDTIEVYLPVIENCLRSGGSGPGGFDRTTLIGVEIIDELIKNCMNCKNRSYEKCPRQASTRVG